jgi:cyclohexa-1,5-dienecarbonyl-CoA hydratase
MPRKEGKPASNVPEELWEHAAEVDLRENNGSQPIKGLSRMVFELRPPVARIALNNPPLNIIDMRMMEELVAALEVVEQPEITCVVLSGSEEAFSAGVDIAAHTPEKIREMLSKMGSVMRSVIATKKITVAEVRGHCLGGGAELAMLCDLVYTSESANWQFPEIKLGCYPPLAVAALSSLVGVRRAAELIFTARPFSGREAVEWGLANECVPDGAVERCVCQAVERLAGLSPSALELAKKAFYAWDSMHLEKGLARAEKIYLEELMLTPDAREGINAFLEKREPVWKKAA